MKITIFGAAGNLGSCVATEAVARGHDVTAVIHNPDHLDHAPTGTRARIGDATDPAAIDDLIAGADLVITATRPAPGREHELVTAAKTLLDGVGASGVRLIVVGGAGTLTVPGTNGASALDSDFVPPAAQAIARACVDQLQACRDQPAADWTYLSPPAQLAPGVRTGHYRLGTTELVLDDHGNSRISMEDLAIALLDEAETPAHHQARFTASY